MYKKEKIIYHLHDDTSTLNGYFDSCTNFKDYIELAKRDGDKAIAFSNHGGIYDWIKKKQECDKAGIKYIHGIETYMCIDLKDNDRGMHLGLYAKNWDGVLELNTLISKSFLKGEKEDKSDRHMYYNPRVSMEEVMNTSDNIVVTTACLQSMLWVLEKRYRKLLNAISIDELDNTEKNKVNQFKIKEMSDEDRAKFQKIKTKKKQDEYLQNYTVDFKMIAKYYIEKRDIFLEWLSKNSHRCFLEVQAHTLDDQIDFNKLLIKWSNEYNIRLIAGTDTHSSTPYKAECRKIVQVAKDSFYGDEDACDLTWKNYDELFQMFKKQECLSDEQIYESIHNTVVFSEMFEDYKLDNKFKYPKLYDDAKKLLRDLTEKKFLEKQKNKSINMDKLDEYRARIEEELYVYGVQEMYSFILFMAELLQWCESVGIPHGDRGSFTGSTVGYILDMTDIDPIICKTVFSRFCNVHRVSLGDIDVDFAPEDRERVYEYIIKRFTPEKTSYILTIGTMKDRKTIDVLSKGLDPEHNDLSLVKIIKNEFEKLHKEYKKIIQQEINLEELEGDEIDAKNIDFSFHDIYMDKIKNNTTSEQLQIIKNDWDKLRLDNKDLFYYFDGIKGTIESKGLHAAGIIGSPITLQDNLCLHYKNGDKSMPVSSCSMKAVDSLNYTKFDILGLKTLGIIKDTEKYANIKHEKAYKIDWNDKNVWDNMIKNPVGVFQFEGDYAFSLLKKFKPKTITHMSMINAALRPSGKSYRDKLISGVFNKNPSKQIDELLKDNNGFLIFQEDTIKFLTDICGFDGGTADIIRRCIGKKDHDTLMSYLPKILNGYCKVSDKPRNIAEKECQEYLKIIEDSSEYQFGFNHSTGYSQNGFRCTRLRTYYPLEFTTAYLNRASNNLDMINGTNLANYYGFTIDSILFRHSTSEYNFNKKTKTIYKGVKSIKGLGLNAGDELYNLRNNKYDSFTELLYDITKKTSLNKSKIDVLIKINYFKEFYKRDKLLKIAKIFYNNKQYDKKTAKKDNLLFDESIIKKYSKKETEKQYSGVDFIGVIKEVEKSIPNNESSVRDIIKWEFDFLGYITVIDGSDKYRTAVVGKKETQYNIFVDLYCLATGKTVTFKIRKQDYHKEIEVKDILKIKKYERKFKLSPRRGEDGEIIRKKNGKPKYYDELDEKEWILNSYIIEE